MADGGHFEFLPTTICNKLETGTPLLRDRDA